MYNAGRFETPDRPGGRWRSKIVSNTKWNGSLGSKIGEALGSLFVTLALAGFTWVFYGFADLEFRLAKVATTNFEYRMFFGSGVLLAILMVLCILGMIPIWFVRLRPPSSSRLVNG